MTSVALKIPSIPFGRKGKSEAAPADRLSDREVGMVSRAKDDRVLPESVFETMVSVMRRNTKFVVTRDGETYFVGAYLKLADIGGLSKKDMRDESKGAIVNAISAGTMSSIYTAELAKEDAVLFIPNKDTVDFMADFSLLADTAVYELCLVDPSDESIEHSDVRVSHAILAKIHAGRETVQNLLGDVLADAHVEERLSSGPFEADEDDGYDEPEDVPGDEPDGDVVPDGDVPETSVPGEGEPPDEEFVEPPDERDGEAGGSVFDEDDDGSFDSDASAGGGETFVGAEESRAAVNRRFFNPGLERELTADGLDQRLASVLSFKPMDYQSETWLGAKANALISAANQKLAEVHALNLTSVRNSYLSKLQAAYSETMSGVDDLTSDERYADMVGAVERQVGDVVDQRVRDEKARLEEAWNQKLAAIGDQARSAAVQSFMAKYGPSHDAEIRDAEHQIRLAAETRVEQARTNLRNLRLSEAQARMDAIDSQLLDEAFEEYDRLAAEEIELATANQREILGYVEAHRAEEIAHDQVAASQSDHSAAMANLDAEWAAKFNAMKSDFEARISAMTADLSSARERHRAELEQREREMRDAASRHDALIEKKDRRIDQLVSDMAALDGRAEAKYQQQVSNLTAERDLLSTQYHSLMDKSESASRRGLIQSAAVGVVALILGLLVGAFFLGGGRESPPEPVTPPASSVVGPSGSQTSDSTPGDSSVVTPDASQPPTGGEDDYGDTIFNDF